MTKHYNVEPQWVLYKEQPYHVSEFGHLPIQERPRALCPVCRQIVILKLGSQRVHHYAHQPDETGLLPRCNASQPETALHLNAKYYLHEQLFARQEDEGQLFIEQKCFGGCSRIRRLIWLEGWDEVRIEYPLDGFRLDVALLQQGRVIGAIEIVVTHATEHAKSEYLDAHGIRWIEIEGTEAFCDSASGWTREKPLPVNQLHLQKQSWYHDWTCPECQEKQETRRRRQHAELRQQQAQQQKANAERSEVKATRQVEIGWSSGRFTRPLIDIVQEYQAAKPSRVVASIRGSNILAEAPGDLTPAVMERLDKAVRQWCQRYRRQGATVDDSMPWQGNAIPRTASPPTLFEREEPG